MQHAIIEGDLVTGVVSGIGAVGAVIPQALSGVPLERLRWNGKAIVDIGDAHAFWVDEAGRKHVRQAAGRQRVSCAWDAVLVRDDDNRWRAHTDADLLAPRIKEECRRRIVAVVKDAATQSNIAAWASELLARRVLDKGKLSAREQADIATAREIRAWVEAMIGTGRNLIAASEAGFADDAHWPAPPEGAAALAARF